MSFYERYEECCKSKGIKPVSQEAADKMGCTKATISTLAKNGNSPKGDIVAGAARMLDVSADYLLGLINEPHPLEIEADNKLTPNESTVLRLLRGLNMEGQEAAIAMLYGLAAQDIYKKYPADELDQKQA